MHSAGKKSIVSSMNAILKAIREAPSLSPLPRAVTEGTLPALVTQLSGSMRALCAAMLRADTGRPLAVICPDDAAARTAAADLRALLEKWESAGCVEASD